VPVGLSTAPSVRDVGQERVPSRHTGRPSIELPSSPGMLNSRVDERRLRPSSATTGTDEDSGHLSLARPHRAGDRGGRVGDERFVDPGTSGFCPSQEFPALYVGHGEAPFFAVGRYAGRTQRASAVVLGRTTASCAAPKLAIYIGGRPLNQGLTDEGM
jgi:hypothetical protein